MVQIHDGRDRRRENIARAVDPAEPARPYFRLGTVLLFQDRIDDAIDRLERAHRANPSFPPVPLLLTAGYGLNGDTNRATRALAEFNELGKRRGWPPATLAILRKEIDWNTPRLHDAFERYFMIHSLAAEPDAGMPG